MIRNPTMQHGTFLCMQRHNPLPSWGIAECTAEPAQSEENSPDYKEASDFFGGIQAKTDGGMCVGDDRGSARSENTGCFDGSSWIGTAPFVAVGKQSRIRTVYSFLKHHLKMSEFLTATSLVSSKEALKNQVFFQGAPEAASSHPFIRTSPALSAAGSGTPERHRARGGSGGSEQGVSFHSCFPRPDPCSNAAGIKGIVIPSLVHLNISLSGA